MNRSLKLDNKQTPIGNRSVIQKHFFFLFVFSLQHHDRTPIVTRPKTPLHLTLNALAKAIDKMHARTIPTALCFSCWRKFLKCGDHLMIQPLKTTRLYSQYVELWTKSRFRVIFFLSLLAGFPDTSPGHVAPICHRKSHPLHPLTSQLILDLSPFVASPSSILSLLVPSILVTKPSDPALPCRSPSSMLLSQILHS